jgi:large subunit ribosomal protein L11
MKKISSFLRLDIEAGKANPSPPVGPALGLRGVNIMNFCKEFNAKTKHIKEGTTIPTIITVFEDRSYSFILKVPSNTAHMKKILQLGHNQAFPGQCKPAHSKLDFKFIFHIAKSKQKDLPRVPLVSVCQSIIGSGKSNGIDFYIPNEQ